MWGKYWEGTLYNDYRDVQLDPIAEDITSKFIKTLPQVHSVYIRGSHVEKTTSGLTLVRDDGTMDVITIG